MLHAQPEPLIVPSNSSWSSPIIMVRKKDSNDFRMVIDYRALNRATKKDAYPIPLIDFIFDTMAGAKCFSSVDVTNGFWSIRMVPEESCLATFTYGNGLFRPLRMTQGLTNAPAIFQRTMERILSEHLRIRCLVFIDDIIIFSKSPEEHENGVRAVLQTIYDAVLRFSK